ncbi:MAG TPA: alpha-2-macroglobulin family protein, partial [Candidatus Eremiobacteraceae bacterium]
APAVLDTTATTDATGAMHQPIPIPTDLPFPMGYSAELTTTDASNLAVASSASFVALPSPELVGEYADYLAPAGKPMQASIVTTDDRGSQIAARHVRVTLARITWSDNGNAHVTDESATDVTTLGQRPVVADLIPKKPGWYRLRANFVGTSRRATEADRDVWVYGPGEVTWSNSDDGRSVALQLDRIKYEPGDRATVLVKSPFTEADLYLAVVRHGTIWHTFEHVTGNAPTVTFEVTRQMLPGAQIDAVLVRRGAPIESFKPGTIKSLVRIGNAGLTVNLDRRYLKVKVKPLSDRLRPGGNETVDLQLADYAGSPVRGQITVMVADESILQLNGYRPPDLVAAIYSGWPVSVQGADNRLDAALAQPTAAPLDQPAGYLPVDMQRALNEALPAGATSDTYSASTRTLGMVTSKAASGGQGGAPVRVNFQQLAYFNGDVLTDDQGHATVTFKVPDNLTTWRVLAVAAAVTPADDKSNFRFGNGDATFITTQPLLANPLLPQFARPGDLFQGGLATNNTSGASGTMQVSGSLTGALVFDNGGASTAVVSAQFAAAAGTQSQRFPMSVRALGAATVEFRIALGESGDAFRVPFLVRPLDITESVVETGATTTGATIPLSIDPNVDNFAGGLQITMASTLLPEILVPAKDCFLFEYLPFAEPLSSRLMVAADMQTLGKKYGQTLTGIDPVAEAADDIVQLAKLQRQDGGFAWWPGQYDSDPYLTGYAAQALGRMQQAGLSTDPVMVTAAHVYLSARLDDPDPHNWCLGYDPCIERMRFEAMLGLAALGDLSDRHVADVYAARNDFDLVTQIEIARFMTALPAWKPKADAMARKIQELVYETGRYAVLNTPEDMWWYDSITKGQAETVRLYVAQKYETAVIDRMVRSLLALRRKGSWANTYDDAQALNALIDYAQLEPEPPAFTATADLNGVQIASNTFNGYRDSVRDTYVATADLPRGSSDLQLRKGGTGTLHYVVSYTYRLHGPQPGAEAGLLISRDVRPVGKDGVVAHMGLAKPPAATTLPAAQVYDVGLTIIADHPVNQVIIVDPLPAGMEAVDATFNTSPRTQSAQYGAWQIDYQVIHHDRVVAFANYLAPGIYTMHYLLRTVTPGTYEWPGSQAFLEYAPEEFGRAASTTLTIP